MSKKPAEDIAELIEITNLCEAFGVLPYSGGLLDQPADLVDGMTAVLMAKNEKSKPKKGQGQRAK